jgi:hypothetical protein
MQPEDTSSLLLVRYIPTECFHPKGEQLNSHDVGQILQKVEAGKSPEWKDIAARSPIHKS